MTIISDFNLLRRDIEVILNINNRTIELNILGNLTSSGVTLYALYSFLKNEWIIDSNLNGVPFPLFLITTESFEFINEWVPANESTINLFRNSGFAIKDINDTVIEEYAGIITYGLVGINDQCYYLQDPNDNITNFLTTGYVNQVVKIYSALTNFDRRNYLQLFVREQGKIYSSFKLDVIGINSLTYWCYRFPLVNRIDYNIQYDDCIVDDYGILISYYSSPQIKTINGVNCNFNTIINGNNKTIFEIYAAVQSLLRKSININSNITPVIIGNTADILLKFHCNKLITNIGVYIDNFNASDINNIEFYDNDRIKRIFPYDNQVLLGIGDYQSLMSALIIINNGIKNASKLIPHNVNIINEVVDNESGIWDDNLLWDDNDIWND